MIQSHLRRAVDGLVEIDVLFFTLPAPSLPPSNSTLTLPGFAQSFGCIFPGSNTVSKPSC